MTLLQLRIYEFLLVRLAGLPFSDDDIVRLSADIWLIPQEEPRWRTASVNTLVSEWKRRLGGTTNIGFYLATLRAGDARRATAPDSVDRAERALKVE